MSITLRRIKPCAAQTRIHLLPQSGAFISLRGGHTYILISHLAGQADKRSTTAADGADDKSRASLATSFGFVSGDVWCGSVFLFHLFLFLEAIRPKRRKKTKTKKKQCRIYGSLPLLLAVSFSFFFLFFFLSSRLLTLPQISNPKNPAHPSFAGAASAVPKITSGLLNRLPSLTK